MKLGRFIIDTHVHAQRHAAGPELRKRMKETGKQVKYEDLGEIMHTLDTYDNSARLLYDMECYGVDMCLLSSAFGMDDTLNLQLVEKYPDKFRAFCYPCETKKKALKGEIEWTIEAACEELERKLSTGKYIGIGEGSPARVFPKGVRPYNYTRKERMDELRKVMDIARKYQVPVTTHTGSPMGYPLSGTMWPENWEPRWIHDIATEYPDVTIIFEHGGQSGGTSALLFEECVEVAANHDNVYLEGGIYWTDLYYLALRNPNVGPEKIIWGTDWGASQPVITQIGNNPQSYVMQVHKEGIVKHQIDVMGWSLRQLSRLDISQDDLNLILGGNALRIFKIDFPLKRMFKFVDWL